MKLQIELRNLNFNLEAIKREYQNHTSRCQQITKEVSKWGKKSEPKLQFLNPRK